MAIKTIDELDPVQAGYTVGENDVLPIAIEDNGSYTTKKIKASALGGGGGGGEVVQVTIDLENQTMTTDKTAAEILALYVAGTPFTGIGSADMGEAMMYCQLQFGVMANIEGTYILTATMISFEETTRIAFEASSGDSPMVASLNN